MIADLTDRLILDSGSKALAAERLTQLSPGFGMIEGHPELTVERLYKEQAIVHIDGPCELQVGSRVRVVPIMLARPRTSTPRCWWWRTGRSSTLAGGNPRVERDRGREETGMEHHIDPKRIHHSWDNSLQPTLRIASGDTVHYDILMAGHDQVHEGDTFEQANFDFDTLYNLPGPLYVEGARAGDTLKVEILDLTPGEWGWCVQLPDFGTLPDHFPDPYLRTFDLRSGTHVDFAPNVRIPFAPFLGTMGNHPDDPATASAFPPHKGGGNIDTRHLTAGSTLWLPVWCEGALFSCGDPHAMQGDGEVCVAAMECNMRASLRFTVEQQTIPAPYFRTAGALTPKVDAGGHHGAMGIAPDLMECTRKSILAMIDWIVAEHGLTRQDAYMLCSLAGDLKILEVVDAGMWNVGFTLPLSIFV